jgi:lysophospholipid acyltransferase (LPLAT)-like uncharacterized protein
MTRRSSGIVVPHPLPWHRRLAAIVVAAFLRFCIGTWRLRWIDSPPGPDPQRPVIYCLWHNRIPLALACRVEATTWLEKNHSIVITPDGPRGPAYRIQDGIIQLAKVTGRPIIPVSTFTHWKIRLKSWDQLQVPLPFTRCDLKYGEPIWIPREASDEEFEKLRLKLEESMRALTRD